MTDSTPENAMISVRDLRVSFGSGAGLVHAVDGVSFNVQPGETYGLVGESGCGKSTILRALCGLNPNWSGDVTIGGEAMTPVRTRSFYRRVQMVFQDPYGSLHPRHTVNTTLTEPLKIHGIGEADERISRVLVQVGLGPAFRYRYPHQLSGGQRQRLAIARALIHDPRLLILDEATSALDPESEALVNANIQRIGHGRTMIIVSHRLSSLVDCHNIMVLDQGAVIDFGPHKDLLERCAIYRQLWLQQHRHLDPASGRAIGPKPVLAQGD
jgi:peptide/nickel transport system ATP-binding protein